MAIEPWLLISQEDQMQTQLVERAERDMAAGSVLSSHEHLRLKNILVPTDFSKESIKAVSYGVALAREFGASIWLLHVVEPAPVFGGFEGIPIVAENAQQRRQAEAQMAEFTAKHVPVGIAVKSLVRFGPTVAEIASLAKDGELDLVVISTHGRTGFGRAVYGSMAERILHHAPCPILVVREQEQEFVKDSPTLEPIKEISLNRILVPLDFTDCSRKALRYAQAFAWKFSAALHCVHFLKPEKPMIVFETESFRKTQADEAPAKMAAHLNEIDPSIDIESSIIAGEPRHGIVQVTDERQIDLIVLGEHCRSGARRLLVGSATDEVVKHAHCPILVVREFEHECIG